MNKQLSGVPVAIHTLDDILGDPRTTPEVRMRVINDKITEHREKVDHDLHGVWRSCCLEVDARALQFFTQMLLLACVMAFCVYQLVTNQSCEAQTGYMGLLTLLIGIIVPAPNLAKVEGNNAKN